MSRQTTINDLCKECYDIADDRGWHDTHRHFAIVIALIHSEVSEALEAYRNSSKCGYWRDQVLEEFADVCIRIFDAVEEFGIGDLEVAILEKMEKNRGRPYRHGGKAC